MRLYVVEKIHPFASTVTALCRVKSHTHVRQITEPFLKRRPCRPSTSSYIRKNIMQAILDCRAQVAVNASELTLDGLPRVKVTQQHDVHVVAPQHVGRG
jgi:hypothetical protein